MLYLRSIVPQILLASTLGVALSGQPFLEWPLEKAVQVLNESPWARTESITRVVGGVGSGVAGEKEIFYTFYVRFLSAQPIREAYTRIQLIQLGYDDLPTEEQARFSSLIKERVEIDFRRFVVVSLAFRSNDPNEESRIRQYFESQTTGTMKNSAFLSTSNFSQVPLVGYYPARESSVGPRFVFPRYIDDVPLLTLDDRQVTFELTTLPVSVNQGGQGNRGRGQGGGGRNRGGNSSNNQQEQENKGILRASFAVQEMVTGGKLVF